MLAIFSNPIIVYNNGAHKKCLKTGWKARGPSHYQIQEFYSWYQSTSSFMASQ